MGIASLQVPQQFQLQGIAGGEIRVAALRGQYPVVLAVMGQQGLAQARAGADEGAGALGLGLPDLQAVQFLLGDARQGVADGLEIVDQAQALEAQLAAQGAAIDLPLQPGDPRPLPVRTVPHGARHGQAGARGRGAAGGLEKMPQQAGKVGEIGGAHMALKVAVWHLGVAIRQAQPGMGAAQVHGQQVGFRFAHRGICSAAAASRCHSRFSRPARAWIGRPAPGSRQMRPRISALAAPVVSIHRARAWRNAG